MRRDESRWCWIVAAVVIVLTTVPYALGFETQGDRLLFTGFVFGVEDGNSYIAKMLQGSQGAWMFRTPYASRVETSLLAFFPYLVLGKLAAGADVHVQLVVLFHLFRIALIPVGVLAIYRFASIYLEETFWRRWVTVVSVAGGGLGWLLALAGRTHWLGSLPLDFYSPEAFGFLAFYGLPHLLLGRILLLCALAVYLGPWTWGKRGIVTGLSLLGLGLVQPLAILSAYGGIAAHLVVLAIGRAIGKVKEPLTPWVRAAGLAIAISLPLMGYYAAGTAFDPSLKGWAAQNVLPSPHPVHLLFAYGVLFLPAILGARRMIERGRAQDWFLPAWLVGLLILAYAPVPYQRRLIDGAWVALVILAAQGLVPLRLTARWQRGLAEGVAGISLATTAFLLVGGVWTVAHPGLPSFRPSEEIRAIVWLGEHAEPQSVVLSAFDTGNVIPAWAPLRSVMGHGPETPDLARLRPQVESFFTSTPSDAERRSLLQEQDVDFVFFGPEEQSLGDWSPTGLPELEPVYAEGDYVVFAVGGP